MISDWPRPRSNDTSVARGERGGHVFLCARKAERLSQAIPWGRRLSGKGQLGVLTGVGRRLSRKEQRKAFTWNLQFNLINVGHTMSRKHSETIALSHQDLAGCKGDSTWRWVIGRVGLHAPKSSPWKLQHQAWVGLEAAWSPRLQLRGFPNRKPRIGGHSWFYQFLCWRRGAHKQYLENILNNLKLKTKIIATQPYVILILW